MAFITHLLKNINRVFTTLPPLVFRLPYPLRHKGSLKTQRCRTAQTHHLGNAPSRLLLLNPRQPENVCSRLTPFSGCLIALMLATALLLSPSSHADTITATRYEAKIQANGQLAISTRFQTELPEQLQNALQQGVPLDFSLSYRLERPTLASYRFKINQLISTANNVSYRLTFHPLTNRYRVAVGTFSTEYNSLATALKAIGAIANWQVLNEGALSETPASEVKAQVKLNLTTTKLPKPFQINAINSRDWDLDSGWHDLTIKQ